MDLDLLNEMIKTTQESLSKRGLERNCSVRLVLSHDVIATIKARYGMIISDPPKPFSQYMGLPFSEGKETQVIIEEEKFGKGQCYAYCEVDGVNLVSTEALQKEVYKQQAIIEFLKKELIHKTCYRQVMKRQYRELKQQMKADNERHTQSYSELVTENARLKHIARYNCIEWHDMEKNPDDFPPKDPEHYGFSISVMCDDGGTAYANLDEKRWCTSRTIKAWFKIPKYLTFKYDGVVR